MLAGMNRYIVVIAVSATLHFGAGSACGQESLIFADGFETGNPWAWSEVVGYVAVPVIDLRADVNRNGVVELDEASEDLDEDSWSADHGAVFLANIDDDQSACPTTGSDAQLAACHDAADDVVNGTADLIDLARLRTVPWPGAPNDASATVLVSSPGDGFVRLFKNNGFAYTVFDPVVDSLNARELRAGVELAIEGTDIVRSTGVWDGFVDVTLEVDSGTLEDGTILADGSDTVRLRLAPAVFRHHLHEVRTLYANGVGWPGSSEFRADLAAAAAAASVPDPLYEIWGISDQWTQDRFETAYMSMPAIAGQHVIHLNFRMPEYIQGSLYSPGRVVFTHLRGPDIAGAVQYDPTHPDAWNHYNAGGNMETIPPFSHDGQDWPLGRVVRGGTASEYPDQSFDQLVDSQGIQPVAYIDTSWLTVGHIDETLSYVASSSPRGWAVLVADPAEAWTMLGDLQAAGQGSVAMFAGMYWMSGVPAEITIAEVVADTDLANANAWAAVEVADQVAQLQAITGVTGPEMVSVPFIFYQEYGGLLAYQPGLINGISLSLHDFGAPETHGPQIAGEDPFKVRFEDNLAPFAITVQWIENWDLYHRYWGEVHCGSNVTRVVPTTEYWWSVP